MTTTRRELSRARRVRRRAGLALWVVLGLCAGYVLIIAIQAVTL